MRTSGVCIPSNKSAQAKLMIRECVGARRLGLDAMATITKVLPPTVSRITLSNARASRASSGSCGHCEN